MFVRFYNYQNSSTNIFVVIFVIFVIIVLIPYKTHALEGCTVVLVNPNSLKKKVICDNPQRKIQSIPEKLPESTFELTITEQNVTMIDKNHLEKVVNLSKLIIAYSNLHYIHELAFRNLNQLKILDLTGNQLRFLQASLSTNSLTYLVNLQVIILMKNPLTKIPNNAFKSSGRTLKTLILSKCESPPLEIEGGAFNGLTKLQIIDLRSNALRTLYQTMEIDLRKMKDLNQFFISNNQWHCDCKLRWLYFYLTEIQHTIILSRPDESIPRCYSPEKLKNSHIPAQADTRFRLSYNDFICESFCKFDASTLHNITGQYAKTVNLTCECFSDPKLPILWLRNGQFVKEKPGKISIKSYGGSFVNSTLSISKFDEMDKGNWTCSIKTSILSKKMLVYNYNLGLSNKALLNINSATNNLYIFMGLGCSCVLTLLIVFVVIWFCKWGSLFQYHSNHPMVICGYHETSKKLSTSNNINPNNCDLENDNIADNDVRFRYNHQDGGHFSANTGLYENSFTLDPMGKFRIANSTLGSPLTHLTQGDKNSMLYTKTLPVKFPPSDKMLNLYCGCNNFSMFTSDNDDTTNNTSNHSHLQQPAHNNSKFPEQNKQQIHCSTLPRSIPKKMLTNQESYQTISSKDFEKLYPKIKQCPFHGSSATLTRVPSKKPCPVHSSTATLPPRLSSYYTSSSSSSHNHHNYNNKIEHRFNCPKHSSRENISVKSLKFDDDYDVDGAVINNNNYNTISQRRARIQRSKSVGKIIDKPSKSEYKPCPLHGDILSVLQDGAISSNSTTTTTAASTLSRSNTRRKLSNRSLSRSNSNIPKTPNPSTCVIPSHSKDLQMLETNYSRVYPTNMINSTALSYHPNDLSNIPPATSIDYSSILGSNFNNLPNTKITTSKISQGINDTMALLPPIVPSSSVVPSAASSSNSTTIVSSSKSQLLTYDVHGTLV